MQVYIFTPKFLESLANLAQNFGKNIIIHFNYGKMFIAVKTRKTTLSQICLKALSKIAPQKLS